MGNFVTEKYTCQQYLVDKLRKEDNVSKLSQTNLFAYTLADINANTDICVISLHRLIDWLLYFQCCNTATDMYHNSLV